MKKLLTAAIAAAIPFSAIAQPLFSNVIFFGDSLSDIGNFPATVQAFNHTPATKLADINTLFYVPISNPVNESGFKVNLVKLFNIQNHAAYQWPHFASDAQMPVLPKINNQARASHSLIWPQFFLSDAYQDNYTISQTLLPSSVIRANKIPTTINSSVDYAWDSALTDAGCANINLTGEASCTLQQIMTTKAAYQATRTPAMQPTVRIPGSQMQVNLFLNDAANGTVKVGPNTVYTLWIGGNDLSAAADKIMKGGLSNIINALGSLLVGTAWNNYLTLNKLLDQQSVPVNHLYLFTLFNSTKIVPKVQGWSSSMKFLDSIVSVVYEKSLNLVVELEQKAHPNASIHLVPTYTWFANMASNKAPYASLFPASNIGKACELGNMAYANAQTPTANCQGYMFWNQEHPSTSVEQIVGYQFEQEVAKTFNQKDSSMDLALANTAPMTLAQQKAWLKQQIIAMLKKEIASKF